MTVKEFQEAALDFFFDMIKWAFNFLTSVTVLGIPVLYIFLGIMIVSVVLSGLLNTSSVSIGAGAKSYSRNTRKNQKSSKNQKSNGKGK